jgi:predicted enzyme related to lactoylglutathione lyase
MLKLCTDSKPTSEETSAMSYLPGKFVWFEHVSADSAKAQAFYEGLFGWQVTSEAMGGGPPYTMISNAGVGIGGMRAAAPGERAHWMSYVSVPDVDSTFDAAVAAGASALMPPTDFGAAGRGATLADPTGALVSLWHAAEEDRADNDNTPAGDWCWNELWTSDVSKALAFYQKVIGYSVETMDMGEHGSYHLLKTGDKGRAGVTSSVHPAAQSLWLPYVVVDDCDASAAQAASLGGTVMFGPADIPDIGRFAILQDPAGGALAIMKPAPRQG